MSKNVLVASAVISAILLAGCAPNQQLQDAQKRDAEFTESVRNINLETADVGSKPTEYQSLVESAIRDQLKDPDSAKFSGFTAPRKEVMVEQRDFIYGYSTCVFVNAKNSYGGYTGKQLYWAFIRNNKILRVKSTNEAYGSIIFRGRPINCN